MTRPSPITKAVKADQKMNHLHPMPHCSFRNRLVSEVKRRECNSASGFDRLLLWDGLRNESCGRGVAGDTKRRFRLLAKNRS